MFRSRALARRSEFPYSPLSASALGGAPNICPNSAHLEVLDETFRIRHYLLDRTVRLADAIENMLGLFDGQDSGAAKYRSAAQHTHPCGPSSRRAACPRTPEVFLIRRQGSRTPARAFSRQPGTLRCSVHQR
jgi:hypothetical protein